MATYYTNGYSWYIQYRVAGKRVKERVGKVEDLTEQDVALLAKAKDFELSTGYKVTAPTPTGEHTIADFAKVYLDWHKTEYPASTARTHQVLHEHLIPAFGDKPLDKLSPLDVENYKRKRRDKVKAATITKELRILQATLNRAVAWDVIARNPVRGVKPPRILDSKPPEFYTAGQLNLLYNASPTHLEIWRLMVNTGLRRMEAHNLKWTNVQGDVIRVLSTDELRTKSGKWREIPLTNGAKRALVRLRRQNTGVYVLPRIHPGSLTRGFLVDAARAGLPGSLHTLRHTYISHLVMAGVPLRTVQILAGHASYTTTEKYAHLAPSHLLAAGTKISL